MATGWLGWTPSVVMNTPICQLRLAIDGKIDFIKATNPFGSGDEKPKHDPLFPPPNPKAAMDAFLGMVKPRAVPISSKGAKRNG